MIYTNGICIIIIPIDIVFVYQKWAIFMYFHAAYFKLKTQKQTKKNNHNFLFIKLALQLTIIIICFM